MKKTMTAVLFALALLAMPKSASAHVYDSDDSDYPLRYVAYLLHPVGVAIEYAVLRPIHALVSGPTASKWFGHEPDAQKEKGTHYEW